MGLVLIFGNDQNNLMRTNIYQPKMAIQAVIFFLTFGPDAIADKPCALEYRDRDLSNEHMMSYLDYCPKVTKSIFCSRWL